MSPRTFQQIALHERPITEILPNTFESETKVFDELHVSKQQTLVQVTYLSLDPAMHAWLRDTESYMPPVKIGEVMRAIGLGVVLSVGEGRKGNLVHLVISPFFTQPYLHIVCRMDRFCSDGRRSIVKYFVRRPLIHIPSPQLPYPRPPLGATALDFLHTLGMPGLAHFQCVAHTTT